MNNIKKALKTIIHKGRMEQLNSNPIIIYDGAHNEQAIENLQDMVKMYYKKLKRVYVISILKRKDYKKMLKLLANDKHALFILTAGNDPNKYASIEELYECMKNYVEENRILKKELDKAIIDVMNDKSNTVNFIIGSFYTYGTVINKINKVKEEMNSICNT